MKEQMNWKKIFDRARKNSGLIILLALICLCSFRYSAFLSYTNISNIIKQSSINGIVSVGMMLVILAGGIDLSVGAVAALAGMIAAQLSNVSLVLAIVVPLCVGMMIGTISGLLVTRLKMEAFIATLSTQLLARGLAHVVSSSNAVTVDRADEAFAFLGRGMIFQVIPMQTVIFAMVVVIFAYVLNNTPYGRSIYAVGGNGEASMMMGIDNNRIKLSTHIISGFLAALGGIILCARLGAGQPTAGADYETRAIAATVLGGTLLSGGWGRVSGTLVGIALLGIISNMMNLEGNVSSYWQNVVLGALLLAVIITQGITQNKLKKA